MKKKIIFRKYGLYLPERIENLINVAIRIGAPILLEGPAGVGKTTITKVVADALGAEYIFYQCTLGTTEDDLLYKYIPSEETKSGIRILLGPLPEALLMSNEKKVVLVLDEFDKTRPSTDAMLLDFIQNTRVSVRIRDERVITGKKENLIVFITSNGERDFSEPLLRRFTVIRLNYLDPKLVDDILKNNGVEDELRALLVQLYIDTINAGLRKPATIQELLQLANAIKELSDQADWDTLVYSFIVKDPLEWEKFANYVASRKIQWPPKATIEDPVEENKTVDSYNITIVKEKSEETESQEPKMPKVAIKHIIDSKVQDFAKEPEKEEYYAIIPLDKEMKAYNDIIRGFNPEPTDNPAEFGQFKVIEDQEGFKIVSTKPFKLEELCKELDIKKAKIELKYNLFEDNREFYVTFDIRIPQTQILTLKIGKIVYYTKNIIRFKGSSIDAVFVNKDGDLWHIEAVLSGRKREIQDVLKQILNSNTWVVAAIKVRDLIKQYAKDMDLGKEENLCKVKKFGEKVLAEVSRKYRVQLSFKEVEDILAGAFFMSDCIIGKDSSGFSIYISKLEESCNDEN